MVKKIRIIPFAFQVLASLKTCFAAQALKSAFRGSPSFLPRQKMKCCVYLLILFSLTGCINLGPKPRENVQNYVLELPASQPLPDVAIRPITLQVSLGQASVPYRTEAMAYQSQAQPNQINYFAYHRWLAPPVTMITNEMTKALNKTGAYQAVVAAPLYGGNMNYQVSIQLLALKQNFSDNDTRSEEQLTLEVVVVRMSDNKAMAAKVFEVNESATPTPEGGVVAANQALSALMPKMLAFVLKNT